MESFVGLPVTHCRGADSRARRKAADQHRPALKWKWPKVCHCEGALRPWQSREGSAVSYRLPLKWHAPIASVAALSERHAGWHYLRHKFIGARPPSLSFRGAKRRGNLLQPVTFSPRPTCYSTWYCEIATSACVLLAMTNPGASAFHSKFLYTTSPMRHTREALMKAARADGERFFTETRLEKRGNTLCTRKGHAASVRRQSRQRLRNISSFSSRWIGEKDPAAAADDFVRASQKKHAEGCT